MEDKSMNNCLLCDKQFVKYGNRKKYCSKYCQINAWKFLNRNAVMSHHKKWLGLNKEKDKAIHRQYYQNNKQRINEWKNTYNKTMDKEKLQCRHQVFIALKKGLLKRESCEFCGISKTEAHHKDYSKPLQVNWVCKEHHINLHYGGSNHEDAEKGRYKIYRKQDFFKELRKWKKNSNIC